MRSAVLDALETEEVRQVLEDEGIDPESVTEVMVSHATMGDGVVRLRGR